MREIKFRVWDKDLEKFFYIFKITSNGELVMPSGFVSMDDTIELIQYTGLKDKNGKEIYEGDIIRTFRRVGRGYREMQLESVHYSAITAKWYPQYIANVEMAEVIGNIYENPKLLEQK